MSRGSGISIVLRLLQELWARRSARQLLFVLLALGSIVFLALLVQSWKLQTNQRVTCSPFISEPGRLNGYLEIQLLEQHAVEPTFNGKIFVYSLSPSDAQHTSVNIRRSGDRNYGASEIDISLMSSNEKFKGISTFETKPHDWKEFGLIAERGLHRYFPFDSSIFDFEVELDPPLEIQFVRVTNRVPGFIVQCEQVKASRLDDGKIHVVFELTRSPIVQLTAVVLGVAGLLFLVFIIKLESIDSLATSVASYFFGLWSIRGIMSSEIRVFPTLFDAWILTLCVVLIVLLTWKVAFRAFRQE